jgi:hypothetical protein
MGLRAAKQSVNKKRFCLVALLRCAPAGGSKEERMNRPIRHDCASGRRTSASTPRSSRAPSQNMRPGLVPPRDMSLLDVVPGDPARAFTYMRKNARKGPTRGLENGAFGLGFS